MIHTNLFGLFIHDTETDISIKVEDIARNNPLSRGWVSHTDAAIDQASPLVVGATDTKLVLGTLTSITTFGPRNASTRAVIDLWDNTSDFIQPINNVGQLYRIRVYGTMENTGATSGDEALEMVLKEVGGSDLFRDVRVVNQASGVDMFFSFEGTVPADAGNIANGIEIDFKALGGTDMNVFDITVQIEAT
jgi:hypothetical protein